MVVNEVIGWYTSYVVVNYTQANNRLAKRGGHTMAITPRHYLDFINQYANLFNEKRSELEEQQMHLNVGLRKIKETVDQVKFCILFNLICHLFYIFLKTPEELGL